MSDSNNLELKVITTADTSGASAASRALGEVARAADNGDILKRTAADYAKLDQATGEAAKSTSLLSKHMGLLGAAGAALKLKNLATEALAYAEGIKDAGERTGITTEEVQRLTYAANQNATSWGDLEAGLKNLAVETQTNADKLAALGIATTDSAGQARPLRDVLGDLSQVMADTEDPSKRTALAVQFLGRSGQQLVPLLSQGRAGLKAFGDEAERTGRVINSDTIAKLDGAKQKLDDFNQRVTIVSGELAAHFITFGEMLGEMPGEFLNALQGLPDGIEATAEKAAAAVEVAETKTRNQIEETIATLARLKQARIKAYERIADATANDALTKANKTIEAEEEANRTPEQKAERAKAAREAQYQQDKTNVSARTSLENQPAADAILKRARDIDIAKIEAEARAARAKLAADAARAQIANERDLATADARNLGGKIRGKLGTLPADVIDPKQIESATAKAEAFATGDTSSAEGQALIDSLGPLLVAIGKIKTPGAAIEAVQYGKILALVREQTRRLEQIEAREKNSRTQ